MTNARFIPWLHRLVSGHLCPMLAARFLSSIASYLKKPALSVLTLILQHLLLLYKDLLFSFLFPIRKTTRLIRELSWELHWMGLGADPELSFFWKILSIVHVSIAKTHYDSCWRNFSPALVLQSRHSTAFCLHQAQQCFQHTAWSSVRFPVTYHTL